MDWKCVWAVKSKHVECGISLWSNPSLRKLEAFSNLASWCASIVLAVVHFLRVFKCHMAATFLRPQKVSWIFLIWFAAHENHSYLFLPCCTTIIALVDHLAISASCLREGKDDPEDGQRPKYCKKGAWVMGFTPVTVYFCFRRACSTEFLWCL